MIADVITSLLSKQVSIDGLIFDAYLELVQNDSLTVTSHPVQTGANVSDHAYRNPTEFDYVLGVTNSSIGVLGGGLMGFSLPLGLTESRVLKAYKALESRMRSRKLVRLKNRYNMDPGYWVLITSVSTDDDYKTCDCFKARVHMKEVIITKPVTYLSTLDSYIVENNEMGTLPSAPVSESMLYQQYGKVI